MRAGTAYNIALGHVAALTVGQQMVASSVSLLQARLLSGSAASTSACCTLQAGSLSSCNPHKLAQGQHVQSIYGIIQLRSLSSQATDANGTSGSAPSAAEASPAPGWLGRVHKAPQASDDVSMWMILTTKLTSEGTRAPRTNWEWAYWGLGTTAVSWYVYDRWLRPKKPNAADIEAKEAAAAALKAKRLNELRALMAGKSFLEGENPFEGMTPAEIMAFIKEQGLNPNSDDPYEGMSPEEIDEYARLHGLS